MVKSMTGYGRAEDIIGGRSISVEVKSVNHRYFDFTAKVPRNYAYLEEKLKSFFQKNVARGKIEVYVNLGSSENADITVEINHPLAKGYVAALRELSETYGLSDDVSAALVSKFPDVLTVSKAAEDEEKVT
ncbi:MAG: YicC/YloC family endoribonuclease, partial [Acutalibacteraceae bacterium]